MNSSGEPRPDSAGGVKATIDIDEVVRLTPNAGRLADFQLDSPRPGFQGNAYNIPLVGWVLPREKPPLAMELLSTDTVLARFELNDRRPDVAATFPTVPHAGSCAFRFAVSALGLQDTFELVLQVELTGGGKIPLFLIRGTRERIQLDQDAVLQPLMLSNLGRSGSTWVTQLLGQHPQIVTYRPFEYEPRIASYWIETLRGLAQPASYRNALDPEVHDELWWLGRDRSTPLPTLDTSPELQRVVERDGIRDLAEFGRGRIERFYRVVAREQEKHDARYFLERFFGTDPMAPHIAGELYAQAKGLFLVRDYRDVMCSIRSYNAKTGLQQFGRDPGVSDEDYIRGYFGANIRALAARWHEARGSAHLLRYEDLVTRPEETLTAVLEFAGLDAHPSTVKRTLEAAMQVRSDRQRQHMTTSDPHASIGRWRNELGDDLRAACAESFGAVLRDFGYENVDATVNRPPDGKAGSALGK